MDYSDEQETQSNLLQVLSEKLEIERQTTSFLKQISPDLVFRVAYGDWNVHLSGMLLKRLTGTLAKSYPWKTLQEGKTLLMFERQGLNKLVKAIKEQRVIHPRIKSRDQDGNLIWLKADYQFILNPETNQAIGVIGKLVDCTEKIEAKVLYNKTLQLWHQSNKAHLAALTINLSSGQIMDGYSYFLQELNLKELEVEKYLQALKYLFINKSDFARLISILDLKRAKDAIKMQQSNISVDYELSIGQTHLWVRLTTTYVFNPISNEVMALLSWDDIHDAKMRERITALILSESYDLIALLFTESDSYQILNNFENSRLIPQSISKGYESWINVHIDKYALIEEAQYLKFCFSLRNITEQLSLASSYSFFGKGNYPDGTATTKFHQFQIVDKHKGLVLYKRQDVNSKHDALIFKIGNKFYRINFNQIIYIESAGKKSHLIGENISYMINEMISSLQDRLPGKFFMRCHRCYLIRLAAIVNLDGQDLILKNGSRVPVSRRNLSLLKTRLR